MADRIPVKAKYAAGSPVDVIALQEFEPTDTIPLSIISGFSAGVTAELALNSISTLSDVSMVGSPAPVNGEVLTWNSTSGMWENKPPTGGGGGTWGSITGTLSDQLDLQSALDAKLNLDGSNEMTGDLVVTGSTTTQITIKPSNENGFPNYKISDTSDITRADFMVDMNSNTFDLFIRRHSSTGIVQTQTVFDTTGNVTVNGGGPSLSAHLTRKDYVDGQVATKVDQSALDVHTTDSTIHFTEGSINHTNIANAGVNTHATIDAHLANVSNPHGVTPPQIGLGNVDDTSDLDKPLSTASINALGGKASNTVTVLSSDAQLITINNPTLIDDVTLTLNSNIANGLVKLDSLGKVPNVLSPDTSRTYLGQYDASTNTLPPDATVTGDYYIVNVGGTLNLAPDSSSPPISTVVDPGDEISWDSSGSPNFWIYIPSIAAPVSASTVQYDNSSSGLISTNLQTSTDELKVLLDGKKLSELVDVSVTGSPVIADGQVLKWNTNDSLWYAGDAISSVVWGDITGSLFAQTDLQTALDGKAETSHVHTEAQIVDLQSYLLDITGEDLGSLNDVDLTLPLNDSHFLAHNGTSWYNAVRELPWGQITGDITTQLDLQAVFDTKSVVGHTHTVGELSDVNITTITDLDVLYYNQASGNWVNGSVPGTQWGSISGTLSAQIDLQAALDAKLSTDGSNIMTGNLIIQSASAMLMFEDINSSLDAKKWDIVTSLDTIQHRLVNDASTAFAPYWEIHRNGMTIKEQHFFADKIFIGGVLTSDAPIGPATEAFIFDTTNDITSNEKTLFSFKVQGNDKFTFTLNTDKNYGQLRVIDSELNPNDFFFGYHDSFTNYAGMFSNYGDFWLGNAADPTTYINYFAGTAIWLGDTANRNRVQMYLSSAGILFDGGGASVTLKESNSVMKWNGSSGIGHVDNHRLYFGTDNDWYIRNDSLDDNLEFVNNGTGTNIVLDGLTWPSVDGTANQVLQTNGSGVLSWTDNPNDVAVWGNITGTLSAQTDLQAALDLKTDVTTFDAHTGDVSVHFTEASIDHLNILNNGNNTHDDIDTHIAGTALKHDAIDVIFDASTSDIVSTNVQGAIEHNASDIKFREPSTTSMKSGGVVTQALTNTVDVSSGVGDIVDSWTNPHIPSRTEVLWSAVNGLVVDMPFNIGTQVIYVDGNGIVGQNPTSLNFSETRSFIELAIVYYHHGIIKSITPSGMVHKNSAYAFNDYITFICNRGDRVRGFETNAVNNALSVWSSDGLWFKPGNNLATDPKSPNVLSYPEVGDSTTPVTFDVVYGDGSAYLNNQTELPKVYEIGGSPPTAVALTGTEATIHYVYRGYDNRIILQLGYVLYPDAATADAEANTDLANLQKIMSASSGFFASQIGIGNDATDFSDASKAFIFNISPGAGGGSGGGGGSCGVSTYLDLLDVIDSTFVGSAGKVPMVDSTQVGLEFTALTLEDNLSDVVITQPLNADHFLAHNGTNWYNASRAIPWGVISGTLSDQVDLQAALDLKTDLSTFNVHTGDATIHLTESSIDHLNILNVGTNTHSAIDTHIAGTALKHNANEILFDDTAVGGGFTEVQSVLDAFDVQIGLRETAATGVVDGGTVVASTATTVDIQSGNGEIVDGYTDRRNPTRNNVSWSGITGYVITMPSASGIQVIYSDPTGTILQQSSGLTSTQRRTNIQLALVYYDNGVIGEVQQAGLFSNEVGNTLYDWIYFTDQSSRLQGMGIDVVTNQLQIWGESGSLFSPSINIENNITDQNILPFAAVGSAVTALSFDVVLMDGSIAEFPTGTPLMNITTIPDVYESSPGIVTQLTGNDACIQYVYRTLANTFKLQLGQTLYNNGGRARDSLETDRSGYINFTGSNVTLLSAQVYRNVGATNFNNSNNAGVVSLIGSGAGSSGSIAVTDYLSLGDVIDSTYVGQAGKVPIVDITETGLQFENIDHNTIANVGTNTHAQIDTHIANSAIHTGDENVKVSATDTTAGTLSTEIVSGNNITLTVLSTGADEKLEVAYDKTGMPYVATIGGNSMVVFDDPLRANKVLSSESQVLYFAESAVADSDWMQIQHATDADSGYMMPFNGTVVSIAMHCENTNGNTKDIDLYIDGNNQGSIGQFLGTLQQTYTDTTLNIDFAAGTKLRLRGGSGQGTIQDTNIQVRVKWRV